MSNTPDNGPPRLLPSLLPNTNTAHPDPITATTASIYAADGDTHPPSAPTSPRPQHDSPTDPEAEPTPDSEAPASPSADDADPDADGDADGDDYPPFHPLFTLITDAQTGETYHPATYYVFSDDEPDALSTAAIHALGEGGDPTVEERYVVVDLAADGASVTAARSLAPRWAVTGAEVRGAPMLGDARQVGVQEGMMLVVEGVGIEEDSGEEEGRGRGMLEEVVKAKGSVVAGMEELYAGISGGLEVLEKVVGEQ